MRNVLQLASTFGIPLEKADSLEVIVHVQAKASGGMQLLKAQNLGVGTYWSSIHHSLFGEDWCQLFTYNSTTKLVGACMLLHM